MDPNFEKTPEKPTNAYELLKVIFYSEINAELASTREKAVTALEKLYHVTDQGSAESWMEWFLKECPDATEREKNVLSSLQVIISSKRRYSDIKQRHTPKKSE